MRCGRRSDSIEDRRPAMESTPAVRCGRSHGCAGARSAVARRGRTPAWAPGTVEESADWVTSRVAARMIYGTLCFAIFFSFIGTATALGLKRGERAEEEVMIPGPERVVVKK